MKRSTPLRRTPMPARGTPMPRSRPRPITQRQRGLLDQRSGGWCEMRIVQACTGAAVDACHRIAVGAGGRHGTALEASGRLSNLVHGCRACHRWCHEHPRSAELNGWMLREGDNPLEVPVRIAGVRVLLDDEGGTAPVPASDGEASK